MRYYIYIYIYIYMYVSICVYITVSPPLKNMLIFLRSTTMVWMRRVNSRYIDDGCGGVLWRRLGYRFFLECVAWCWGIDWF